MSTITSAKKKSVDNFYKLLGNGRGSSKKTITLTVKDSITSLSKSASVTSFHTIDTKKSDSYTTLIQMLKSDLFQIQDMINSNSKNIKMFKLLSKSPGLSKKLSEIEKSMPMEDMIEKINDSSQKYEKIFKIYGCTDSKQLVQKIYYESNLYELLLGKIHDFFILMKLSLHKDDTYQDSLSKIINMKDFIEKTADKLNKANNTDKIIKSDSSNIKNFIYKIKSLPELINSKINNDNKTIKDILDYIIKLINEFFNEKNKNVLELDINADIKENNSEIEKFEKIWNELINKIKNYKLDNANVKEENENLNKKIEELENQNLDIINLKSEFEEEKNKLLQEIENSENKYKELENDYNKIKNENLQYISELNLLKEEEQKNNSLLKDELEQKNIQINTLEKSNSDLTKTINELTTKIKELNNKIKDLENSKNKYIDINQTLKNAEIEKIMSSHQLELKRLGNDILNKNKNQLRDLENKLKNLQTQYDMIVLERESLKRNIIFLKGKKYDPDSYEAVLKEQFETMRSAFVAKIDELNEELTDIKRDSRIKIYQLELELKENVKLKNNFLKQIITLQAQLDEINKE